jgi:hypothetical protein
MAAKPPLSAEQFAKKLKGAEAADLKAKKEAEAACLATVQAAKVLEEAEKKAHASAAAYDSNCSEMHTAIVDAKKIRDSTKSQVSSTKTLAKELNANFNKALAEMKKGRQKLKADARKRMDAVDAELKAVKKKVQAERNVATATGKKKNKEVDAELKKSVEAAIEAQATVLAQEQGVVLGKDRKQTAALAAVAEHAVAAAVAKLEKSAEVKRGLIEVARAQVYEAAAAQEAAATLRAKDMAARADAEGARELVAFNAKYGAEPPPDFEMPPVDVPGGDLALGGGIPGGVPAGMPAGVPVGVPAGVPGAGSVPMSADAGADAAEAGANQVPCFTHCPPFAPFFNEAEAIPIATLPAD